MTDDQQAAQADYITCDHHWVHHHPAHSLIWIVQCDICDHFNAADMNEQIQNLLSAAAVREEEIKARKEKRYRAAIGNWREAALKAEGELVATAVRYRAEGIERAAEVAGSSTLPLRRGWDLNTGSRSQWYANGVRDAAARVRALLDENNETQEN